MIAIIDYKAGNLTTVVKTLRGACSRDERMRELLPSTKGLL